MFETCPSGKHRLLSHLQTSSCAFFSNTKLALDFATHDPSQTNHIFTVTKQRYIQSSLDVVLCLPLHIHDGVENVLKHVIFNVHDVKVMAKEDWSSNKKAPKRYFVLPNYGSNQNQRTSAYLIGDQTQCHRTLIQHHAILHQKDAGVQHPYQLCQ